MHRWFAQSTLLATLTVTGATSRDLVAQQDSLRRNLSRKPGHAAPDTNRVTQLAPLVVTGARVPVSAERVGFAVGGLSARSLRREPAVYSADALRRVPGITLDEANGPGGPTIIRIRGGEEVYNQILVDGVQINQSGGFFDFQGVALSNLEGVEVARGPQSAQYGSSAMSGVVQFLTRRGEPGRPRVEAEAEGGAAAGFGGEGRANASVGGGTAGGSLLYSAGYGFTAARGMFRLPNDLRSHDASLRVDAAPPGRLAAHATLRYLHTDGRLPVRDPGATRIPLDPNARNDRGRLAGSVGLTLEAGAGWTHGLTASLYHDDFVYDDRKDGVTSDSFFVFDADFRLHSRFTRAAVEYAASHPLGSGGRGALALGGRWEHEAQHDQTGGEFGAGDLRLGRPTRALFGEASYSLGSRVDLLAGSRLEWTRDVPAELTPRGSVVVHLVRDRVSLRAAAGRGFKVPDLQQRYLDNPFIVSNPDLRPETSTSWEAGGRLRALSGRVEAQVTYFDQRFHDVIRTVQLEGDSRQINRNLGASTARGVEAEVTYDPGGRWSAGGYGAWTRTRIGDNAGLNPAEYPLGEALPGRPTGVGTAWLAVEPGERISLVLRGSYVGPQTVLSERFTGRRIRVPGYALAGVGATWRVTPRLEVFGRVENALDHRYETAFDRPGIRRTVALGARLPGR